MEIEMEAGGPSSKRRRSVSPGKDEDGGGVDRISALPDAVLGEIITLLPTKDGGRTRILASRWRHLWRSAPLNLQCRDLGQLAGVLVSRILSSHQGPGRRFCITQGSTTTMDAWLRSAALDNLQELDVWYGPHRPLPASTLRFSATLRVFTIGGCDLSNTTVQPLHFPLLKQLGIEHASVSEHSLHNLIASCPILECFFIKYSVGFSSIRINSPSIESIAVSRCGADGSGFHLVGQIHLHELIIENAPCLETLLDLCNKCLHVSVVSAPKLDTLGFLSEQLSDGMGMDLSTRLVFGSTAIQGLRVYGLAMVVRTVKVLAIRVETLNLDVVIELMRCFPCLEKLYIQGWSTTEKNLWRRKHRELIKCFDICLKTIVISTYIGLWSEVNFATFFVLNAKSLELMIFEVNSANEEFISKAQKKLQLDNRASRGLLLPDLHFQWLTL
ncbi:hypothetical protein QYE76_000521 [Lolium multiflorum]|uniref:FERM domain-containing protein n=1 Tax=Lolium multiflorum TaxID=4521 RepID=A0AAD8VYU1_LOLMU|nr:hypothetical protein QYE76_000521 [Lolium multiflorum]